MAVISLLDQDTINQIAAGEVVERPSSVVKELLENSMDAGATAVTAEIRDGGIGLIRITDNGFGIEPDQIRTAFLRHTTSKIRNVSDLLTLKSLGFRGEALSSICAVAQVELITKTRGEPAGIRYLIEGGEERKLEEIGCPDGTTFLVRNLFYNTPARLKFLKSPATEAGYINDLVERLAISHPEISFTLINNGKTMLHTSGNRSVKDVLYQIYGREITSQLALVQYEEDGASVSGYTGRPVISRGNRNYENYFINGRYVRSPVLMRAIEDAYKPYTMTHKYPFTALHFDIDTAAMDVNVHPTKLEVRFSDPEFIYRLANRAVSGALNGLNMIPAVEPGPESRAGKPKHQAVPEPFERNRRERTVPDRDAAGSGPLPEAAKNTEIGKVKEIAGHPEAFVSAILRERTGYPAKITPEGSVPVRDIPARNSSVQDSSVQNSSVQNSSVRDIPVQEVLPFCENPEYRIIGQLFSTYWLVETGEELYIIDQHAAHEKILYERTMKTLQKKEFLSQRISPPIVLTLNSREEEALAAHRESLEQLGFEIEPFGGREYCVTAYPADQFGIAGRDLLIELLDSLVEETLTGTADIILEKIASLSCKAAVKGNHTLNTEEAKSLIQDLMTLVNPYHCPHGRPILISISRHEIEKKFKRIV